jgi:hypothetical protein
MQAPILMLSHPQMSVNIGSDCMNMMRGAVFAIGCAGRKALISKIAVPISHDCK